MDVQAIKQRFGIIGNSPLLNRAIDIAQQVAPTDLTVLIAGESGSGKEVFSKIIHNLSQRKHNNFIAVNCGAIPEGTVDSELFGHEKGSFTGAQEARKGWFEEVDGGTIFLDEVAELPLGTQARLLRVLESGEYLRVGSNKVRTANVRVIAATNVNLQEAVTKGKFREDLFYRLNTVPLYIPPLKDRPEDIHLLFRKFLADCSLKYRRPALQLDDEAVDFIKNYNWPGNVRQLKNIAERICVLHGDGKVTAEELRAQLPAENKSLLPVAVSAGAKDDFSERDILYKVLFDMKRDMVDLKKLVQDIIAKGGTSAQLISDNSSYIKQLYSDLELPAPNMAEVPRVTIQQAPYRDEESYNYAHEAEEVEESLSLVEQEAELIKRALQKHKGKRKLAAQELEISERTLYRKIKDLNLNA